MSTTRTARTDLHAPKSLVTEDYEYVTYFDFREPMPVILGPNANGQYMTIPVPAEVRAWRAKIRALLAGNSVYGASAQCDHCGNHIRYSAVLKHLVSGEHISVGEQCLDNRFSRATADFQAARKQAQLDREQQRIKTAVREFVEANPDLAWMGNLEASWVKVGLTAEGAEQPGIRPNFFVLDVSHKLRKYGDISPKQLEAVHASLARDAEFAARRAEKAVEKAAAEADKPKAEVPTGRQVITGVLLSTKVQESQFGTTIKMLVEDDRGFRVWGTVPNSLFQNGMAPRGWRVSFAAEVEASRDDKSFGFYKRPTQAKRLGDGPVVLGGK